MRHAVITGASAGLGAAFAEQLAAEGFGLTLVARDEERMAAQADRLGSGHSVEVRPLPADLSRRDGLAKVAARLRDDPPDLLVNNAGIALATAFWENSPEGQDRLLDLNVRAVMRLTHAALQPMLRRGRGDVINVASVAGLVAGDADAAYAASKAWAVCFTESLAVQLAGRGVRLSVLCPGYTRTEIHDRAGIDVSGVPRALWLERGFVVREALRGHRRGRVVVVPGRRYRGLVWAARHLPRPVVHRASGRVYRGVLG
ncbi:SDR family NAD(P)-dependent oxidoreductase [Streptomyces boncukensis]|uniref:SDR family NAD(P)-dependent oxidoreductase n=1 Tax=Streptomyces boncukensis TaxID=2711219 RepID=A0A6G4WZ27_9ACTN|nr:SDR family NAD(P)-dependent oxidoreductase [Streptomyces boncukensis]NGO69774.1 SDR family NAD(P)-dependent oxidoreductase [Streptomyces boncukensis]